MNGLSVDGVTIAVEASRDHGVVLFNDRNEKGFFAKSEKEDGDKWSHDKYELIKEGKPMKEVIGYTFRSEREPEEWEGRGRGRGGRGGRGRGRMPRAEYIESQFEKYIAERDARLNKQNNVESNESKPTEGEATASTEANVPKPVGEEGPIE
ncbi:RNA-binding protein [Angomonas deanei]|uniref:Uncharacterized protein n=1 Tax=Angomonas deanei TaxID=59799 RepID=A0A7G2CA11_9TRYP|nr:RNA-binding protein [Angomonas deanei]CAD2215814.1 hypothetical protein, conserved [Angomonas deanei]|eukprot:EPY19913.1 RNA-binding protein [Angomonas deanei]